MATAADEVVDVISRELAKRRDWMLHEQDAVEVVCRRFGEDRATARERLEGLVAAHVVVRHRPRRRSSPNGVEWPPRCEQDCYSLAGPGRR